MTKKRTQLKLADKIRQALESSGKTRYQVSKESGVDQAALSRFVQGKGLSVESLEAIAGALGLEIVLKPKGKEGR